MSRVKLVIIMHKDQLEAKVMVTHYMSMKAMPCYEQWRSRKTNLLKTKLVIKEVKPKKGRKHGKGTLVTKSYALRKRSTLGDKGSRDDLPPK